MTYLGDFALISANRPTEFRKSLVEAERLATEIVQVNGGNVIIYKPIAKVTATATVVRDEGENDGQGR